MSSKKLYLNHKFLHSTLQPTQKRREVFVEDRKDGSPCDSSPDTTTLYKALEQQNWIAALEIIPTLLPCGTLAQQAEWQRIREYLLIYQAAVEAKETHKHELAIKHYTALQDVELLPTALGGLQKEVHKRLQELKEIEAAAAGIDIYIESVRIPLGKIVIDQQIEVQIGGMGKVKVGALTPGIHRVQLYTSSGTLVLDQQFTFSKKDCRLHLNDVNTAMVMPCN